MKNYLVLILFVTVYLGESKDDSSNFTEIVTNITKFIDEYPSNVLSTNNDQYFDNESDPQKKPKDFGTYDFIIIGGGTAGGVLANRLTETNFSVLLLEAGKEEHAISKVLGLSVYLVNSDWNWGYNTTVQTNSCLGSANQQCAYPRGKCLGGSSSTNMGIYSRGHRSNYDTWEELGNPGWSFEQCLPYFKKAERAQFERDIDASYHGFDGPQAVDTVEDVPVMTDALSKAFNEVGIPEGDYNGENQIVVSRCQMFLDGNTRSSSARSYIKPAAKRSNLVISTESLVTKILISDDLQATGAEFWKNGEKYNATARKEVILSAGAINSPQILMLSGIGPQDELKKHNIPILVESNAVGKNLRDHMWYPGVVFRTNCSVIYNNTLKEKLELWKDKKRPLIISGGQQVITYYKLDDNKSTHDPDMEVLVLGPPDVSPDLPRVFGLNEDYQKAFENLNGQSDIIAGLFFIQPKSVGTVKLQSADPKDYPLIDPNYFSHPEDLETMYKAIEKTLDLLNTDALKAIGAKLFREASPGCDGLYEKFSKDWWICDLKNIAMTLYHPCGTAQMGTSIENAVVNADLEVYNVQKLRVVDASVIPAEISGHTNAPVVMIAEKIADVIKAKNDSQ